MVPPQGYVNVSRRPPDIEDYIEMLRRYRSWILGPTFAGLVLSVMVAFFWPDTFISSAVMRITPQKVPEKLVPSNVSSQIQERLNSMQTEIMSRTTLQDLVQRPALDLYKRERQSKPMEDVVEDMRKAIRISVVEMTVTPSSSRAASAFRISFSYPDKYKAQAVVGQLVTKFTEQNATVQRNQASLTASFLGDELRSAKEGMDRLDQEITAFKVENQGRLPEQLQSNLSMVNSLHAQMAAVSETINRNAQEKLLLETTLQNFQNQYNLATANLEETIATQAARNDRRVDLDRQILNYETQLAAAKERYRDAHPDIAALGKTIAVIRRERDALLLEEARAQSQEAPVRRRVNPQTAQQLEQIKAGIAGVKAHIQAKELDLIEKVKRQDALSKAIQAYQAKIEVSPANEQRYAAMLRDFTIAKVKYEEMSRKTELAATAQSLEERQAGETLEVLDPASLPEKPSDPNRYLIAGVGTGLGFLCGLLLAAMKEMKDTSLKNLKDVRAYTNLPVLSSIPVLENALLVRRKRRLFWLAWSSAVIVGTIAMSGSMYYYYWGQNR